MTTNGDDVIDNPTGWVSKHIERYVKSDGKQGHTWYGKPTLLMTTIGRKSGQPRRTALIYGRDGDNYVLVASNGGAVEHPLWYHNLSADPHVHLQVGADHLDAVARDATAEERDRLWPEMVKILPQYKTYQKKTERIIPVIVLEPTT